MNKTQSLKCCSGKQWIIETTLYIKLIKLEQNSMKKFLNLGTYFSLNTEITIKWRILHNDMYILKQNISWLLSFSNEMNK